MLFRCVYVFFKLLVLKGLLSMNGIETGCAVYEMKCLSDERTIHSSKLCDGKVECVNRVDESELYCGTGCLTTQQNEHRIINCGRKVIKIINAWNVPADFILELYIATGEAINISKMYSHCNSYHQCDVFFSKGLYKFSVVLFQCNVFSSTSPPIVEHLLSQTRTKVSFKGLSAFSSTSSPQILNSALENFTTQNMSFTQSTTMQMSIGKGKQLPVTYIIIGIIGGVIICIVVICLLYRSQKGKDDNTYEQTHYTKREDEYDSIQQIQR